MNVYALHFLALLALDSASVCAQINLPIKSSVSRFHVLDASANWEQSGTGTESVYTSHQLSARLQLLPSESRWELPWPCMCCLPSGSNGGWFTFMAQGEKNTEKHLLN